MKSRGVGGSVAGAEPRKGERQAVGPRGCHTGAGRWGQARVGSYSKRRNKT